MYGLLDISASALTAQRVRIDTIAGNIANAFATEAPDSGKPLYQRRVALLEPGNPAAGEHAPGVHVAKVIKDDAPPRLVRDEFHPHAIQSGPQKGYVQYPNVDLATEMINAMEAARAYEANLSVMDVTKSMVSAALRIVA